jgi:outer membrane protein assembly factor BamA
VTNRRWAAALLAIAITLPLVVTPAHAQAPEPDPYEDATATTSAPPAPHPEGRTSAPAGSTSVPAAPATEPEPEAPPPASRPGGPGTKARIRYTLEGIELRGNHRTANRVVLRYVRFRAGDALDVDDPELELTRYRLLGTGFFASVDLSLRKGSRRGAAVLVIEVVERNTFVVQNLWLGLAADEDTAGNAKPLSAFVGLEAAETNLAGTGISLGAGVGLAADQLALRARFADPAFAGTGWSAAATLLYNDALDFFGNRAVAFESPSLVQREVTDYAVVAYKRFGGTIGTGHDLTLSTQFQLEYHLEQVDATVPTIASHMRGDTREPIQFDILGGKSVLSTVRAGILHDTRDAPFLTTHGTLASASVTVGLPPLGSSYGFQKVELAVRRWFLLPWGHVLRLGAYGGGIAGDAPFFEKFYVGDFTDLLPDRVLDLAPDRRQPPNLLGTDIVEVRYGDFAARLDAEYRVPLYTGRGAVYGVDLFATAGIYGVATRREFTDPPTGYSGAQRLPIDLTYNLGVQVDTKVGGITIAFSNLLGLLPARHGERQ